MTISILVAVVLLGAAPGSGVRYIRAGWVFDGERFLGSRVVVIEGEQIVAVEDSSFGIPAGAEVIDASSATVMPGLIDGHVHIMAPPMPYEDNIERHGWGRLAAQEASGFPDNRRHLLLSGVTGIADMGGPLPAYLGVRRALEKGNMAGPELFFSGPLITASGGRPVGAVYEGRHDLILYGLAAPADTFSVRREVQTQAERGVDFVVLVYDSAWYQAGTRRPDQDVVQTAIEEAHRLGLRVFADVGSEEEARQMVRAGADGIEHDFAAASDTLLVEMSRQGVFFTPTIGAVVHSAAAAVDQMEQTLARAWKLGVPLVVGSGYPESYAANCGDDIYEEMALFEQAGIPRLDVLRAATSGSARKLGKGDELGYVAPGYRANLVFVRGSADSGALSTGRIERVMLKGRTAVENGVISREGERGLREQSASFLGYPFWDPLLSWMAGVSATDFDLFHSGVAASADLLFSVRNMWDAGLALDLPSPVPKTALRAGFYFDNMDDLYYGTGNDTRVADDTEYSKTVFGEWIGGRTRFGGPWKVLSSVMLGQSTLKPFGDESLPAALAGSRGGNEAIVSLTLAHDTRDHETNPWYGHYAGVGIQLAPRVLPRGHGFGQAVLDARGFVSLGRGHIVAGRLLCQQAFGDVPFYYLPEFGGDTLGRGYLPYRFRDRASVIGQLEFRFPIWSSVSGAVFTDFGQFQPGLDKLRLNGFHPSVGFGPRVSFGPNETSIVGLDVGFTPEGLNLVLHNGQVF